MLLLDVNGEFTLIVEGWARTCLTTGKADPMSYATVIFVHVICPTLTV
jgi:hypothetical protein